MCNGSDDAVLADIPVGREATWRLLCALACWIAVPDLEAPSEKTIQSLGFRVQSRSGLLRSLDRG